MTMGLDIKGPTNQRLHKAVEDVWKTKLKTGGFNSCLKDLEIVHVEENRVISRVTLEKNNANSNGSAHGGFLCTIVDCCGSLSVTSAGLETVDNGVSTEINISFMQGCKIGSVLDIESKCLRIGSTLAFTEVNVFSNGVPLATGRHTKYIAKALEKAKAMKQQQSSQL
ncbi:hypothetical protein H4219_005745 [Mycoemilia scoparia]|uniref:Thioesterase domain-containing protein n=1 Tax=Mycoemilia scoparia TaxID=417184 RepID=A0A9W7ZMV2_9FUNG|nr:hypothetical protein H4219_005745 [Mycoemilia scoparia]